MKLDTRDWKLLYELEKNARSPLTRLAKKIGISKQLCRYKLKKLEEEGVILSYHAIIDTSKLGFTTYRVYLRFRHMTVKRRRTLLTTLSNIQGVVVMNSLDGYWDVGIAIMVENIYDFHEVWENFMQHREFIEDYDVSLYSPIYHFTRVFLSPGKSEHPQTLVLGGKTVATYDKTDLEILKEITPNIRIPLTKIAEKIGKSPQFVINRVKQMEKNGIIQGYRPVLNWNKLGYDYYKIDITLSSHTQNKQLFAFCEQHPYVFQVDKTIGGSDFEVEIYAKSKIHFKKIVQEIQDTFAEIFVSYTYFTVEDVYKETYFPT